MEVVETEELEDPTDTSASAPLIVTYIVLTVVLSRVLPDFVTEVAMSRDSDEQKKDVVHATVSELALCITPASLALCTENPCSFCRTFPVKNLVLFAASIVSSCLMSLSLVVPLHCSSVSGSVITHCLIPALCEEFVFRGWLFSLIEKATNQVAAAILVSVIFSLLHKWVDVMSAVIIFTFSLMWTYADVMTCSLIPSMCGHFFHNLTLSKLVVLFPALCHIPRMISLALWTAATVILFAGSRKCQNDLPQALQA